MGLFLAQLFEPEVSQKLTASQLSSRDTGTWETDHDRVGNRSHDFGLQAIISALLQVVLRGLKAGIEGKRSRLLDGGLPEGVPGRHC